MPTTKDDRPVEPLSPTVFEDCTISIEEQYYQRAFSLLSAAITDAKGESGTPVRVPPPQYLALAATISVHPRLTSRARRIDYLRGANEALSYLRLVAESVHPRSAGFRDAFSFTGPKNSRLRAPAGDAPPAETHKIRNLYAGKQAMWNHVESFWSLVGWAFNCSVAHRSRWDRYSQLLGLWLGILDDDLEHSASRAPPGDILHGETLIAQYLSPICEGRENRRKVLRAILADGGTKSLAEFGEIWPGETKKAKERVKKRRSVDLENDNYGDYYDSETENESLDSEPGLSEADQTPIKSIETDGHDEPSSVDQFGGIESILLRQRLLATLVRLSEVSPASFLDTEGLFDLLTEFLRPLPLGVFQQFVTPLAQYLTLDQQASLNEMLLRPLTSTAGSSAPLGTISHDDFKTRYARLTAVNTSLVDNAKVGLLVESLLRALWKSDSLVPHDIPALKDAINLGTEARLAKTSRERTKTTPVVADSDDAEFVMRASSIRMKVLVMSQETLQKRGKGSQR